MRSDEHNYMRIPHLTGIAGGIGSGKSMVSRLLRLNGYAVYDCDYEAKRLMARDDIVRAVVNQFGTCICDGYGSLDRTALAHLIFNNAHHRLELESIVHPAVRADLYDWLHRQHKRVFVESAILASSGIVKMCDDIWHVDAPQAERIVRLQKRSAMTQDEILSRMNAQRKELELLSQEKIPVFKIINNDNHSLIVRIFGELLDTAVN